MMSEPTTVDNTTVDELTGKLVLLIEEDRPWRETELMHRQMSAKVKHYVRYVRSKEFAQEHGQRPEDTIVRLVSGEQPDDPSIEFLRRVGYELSKHGIEFEQQVGEHGVPVSLTTEEPIRASEVTEIPPAPLPAAAEEEQPETERTEEYEPAMVEAAEPIAEEQSEPVEAETEFLEPAFDDEEFAEPEHIELEELPAGSEFVETTPSFARPEETELEAKLLDTSALFDTGVSSLDGPSDLEMLVEGPDGALESAELAEFDGSVGSGKPSGKKGSPPPFFPEEEFGRALPDVDEVEAILMTASTEPAVIETSSGKKFLLDVSEATSGARAAGAQDGHPNLFRAVGAALAAALAGAIIWAGLSLGAGHGASPLALAIALMVGISVRLRGNGHSMPFRLVGIFGTLLGSILGAVLAGAALSASQDNLGFGGIIANLSSLSALLTAFDRQYGLLDVVSVLLALYVAFKLSASRAPSESPKG
jgi:hypothetical protein